MTTPPTPPSTPPAKTPGCGGCLMALVGLVVVIGVAVNIMNAANHHDGPDDRAAQAEIACQHLVTDALKAPSTASFGDVTATATTVSGYVDAENSFGATIRNQFTCTITGTSVHLTSLAP